MEAVTGDENGSVACQRGEMSHEQPPGVPVNEKIIFCIDITAGSHSVDGEPLIDEIVDILGTYTAIKQQVNVKSVDFLFMLLISGDDIVDINLSKIPQERFPFMPLKACKFQAETGGFDLSLIFNLLVEKLVLPDKDKYKGGALPPWIYHCIFVFGRNIYVPVMKDGNAFDILKQSPFFTFDVIYICNFVHADSNCDEIVRILLNLAQSLKGYFFVVSHEHIKRLYGVFSQLLGHPSTRPPQDESMFSITKLCHLQHLR